MKLIISSITLFFTLTSLASNHAKHEHSHSGDKHGKHDMSSMKKGMSVGNVKLLTVKGQKNDIHLNVQGMVCAFCAQGVKKKLGSEKSVKTVKVDLDTMSVFVDLNQGTTLSNEVLIKAIEDSGFKVVSVSRKQ